MFFSNSVPPSAQDVLVRPGRWTDEQLIDGTVLWTSSTELTTQRAPTF